MLGSEYHTEDHLWMCSLFPLVSRLYRSLEDYDVVRGIFGGKVGTKSITCAALQAEANTDFAEAVKLYNEVLFPMTVEADGAMLSYI